MTFRIYYRFKIYGLFLLLALSFQDQVFAEDKITISGTGDSQELLRKLAAAYEKASPGRKIIVPDSIGSSGGVKATALGKCDLGRVARKIKEHEKKYQLSYEEFALSPVVFVTSVNQKKVKRISTKQLVDVYSGKIKDWKELGGDTGKVYVMNRENGDSSRSLIELKVPGFKAIKEYAGQIVYSTPDAGMTMVDNDNVFGFLPLCLAQLHGLNILALDGVEPSADNVRKGTYPLVLSFALIWKGALKGLAKDFVAYIFSKDGQAIITRSGSIPVSRKTGSNETVNQK